MHIHSRAHVRAWTAAGFHAYEDALRDRKEDETPGSARMLPCPPEIRRASRRHGEGEQADCHDVTNRDFSTVINGAYTRRSGRSSGRERSRRVPPRSGRSALFRILPAQPGKCSRVIWPPGPCPASLDRSQAGDAGRDQSSEWRSASNSGSRSCYRPQPCQHRERRHPCGDARKAFAAAAPHCPVFGAVPADDSWRARRWTLSPVRWPMT